MHEDDFPEMAYEDRTGHEQGYCIPFVCDGERGARFPDAGTMHEPDEYLGELDWPNTGDFTD